MVMADSRVPAAATSVDGKRVTGGGSSLSVDQRREMGRSRRSALPRSALAELVGAEHRSDPVALLESQAISRVPELMPIRYGRMLASPLAFLRGAALIMASDLAAGPDTGLNAQLCGDAHLCNFGLFASAERRLVFDVNDFDETLPGPWEWDVKRLAASLALAACGKGFTAAAREQLVRSCVKAYRQRMRTLAAKRELDVWYAETRIDAALRRSVDPKFAQELRRAAGQARARDTLQALSKLTRVVDGQLRLVSDPPLLVPIDELVGEAEARSHKHRMAALIDGYRQSLLPSLQVLAARFHAADMARKVVGVGSVGLRSWVVLMVGRGRDDPLMLQVKEAQHSVLERYLHRSAFTDSGERVVVGQRLMQASGDILLGWLHTVGPDGHEGDYYVRQLLDWKGSLTVESMTPQMLADYGRSCGEVLARAHARTGDSIAIAAYLGTSDAADIAFTRFAEAYAKRNERDYAALQEAARDHRVPVARDL
jgi:uncharacterized protein (DUF2252 family)